MPEIDNVEISCGIRQLSGLCRDNNHFNERDKISPEEIISEAFHNEFYGPVAVADIKFSMIIFSDSIRRGNGARLAEYITENKLGKIIPSDVTTNPNTKRTIQMWIWQLNRTALVKWLKANKKEPEVPAERPRHYNNGYRAVNWNGI